MDDVEHPPGKLVGGSLPRFSIGLTEREKADQSMMLV
jgi:hypothetical protein